MQQTVIHYRTIEVDGISIFYREAGSSTAPAILLLHGFPSSSRMFEKLIPGLAGSYHVIAPDYPGFGHSDAPPASSFSYTFEHLSQIINAFTDSMRLNSYVLYLQDYGGPVGFRLAVKHPKKVRAIIIQNAVIHAEGLSSLWASRVAYWKDHTTNDNAIRKSLHSVEAAQQRHLGGLPDPELIDPDYWMDEYLFLQKPEQEQIQMDLFYDYRKNVEEYPIWQEWLQKNHPPMLIVWGSYDPIFTLEGANGFKKLVPDAEVHILNAGHFALDVALEEIQGFLLHFLQQKIHLK